MYPLNKRTTAIMQKLIAKLEDGYFKLDNAPGSFMSLSVEKIMTGPGFEAIFSLAHYGEQNGDLMADPEMTFGLQDDLFYPLSFRNDYVGVDQQIITGTHINLKLQLDLVKFSDMWLRNVIEQQGVTL